MRRPSYASKFLFLATFLLSSLAFSSKAYSLTITSGPTVTGVWLTSATVQWTTDIATNTWLAWGEDVYHSPDDITWAWNSYDPTLVTNHTATATGLVPGLLHGFFAWAKGPEHADLNLTRVEATTQSPDPNLPFDFALFVKGGLHITQGGATYINVIPFALAGDYTQNTPYHLTWDTLPSGISVTPNTTSIYGNYPGQSDPIIYIQVASTVLPQLYPIAFHLTSAHGLQRSFTYNLTVDPPVTLTKTSITTIPPIPAQSLSDWQSMMTANAYQQGYGGEYFCDPVKIYSQGIWQSGVWFYDGERNYYDISDYTLNPIWNACAGYVQDVYRSYVLQNDGGFPGYFYMPHGLSLNVVRTGDPATRLAAREMAANNGVNAPVWWVLAGSNFREVSFFLHTQLRAQELGLPVHGSGGPTIRQTADLLMGMVDQVTLSQNELYIQPYMAGLAMWALIEYYAATGDERAPVAVKHLADWIWPFWWNADQNGNYQEFSYDSVVSAVPLPNDNHLQLLNMLVAPGYAWLWAKTGDDTYRQRADLAFQGGVHGADIGETYYGKQFSQMYRWSFEYVRWRQHPELVAPNPGDQPWTPTVITHVVPTVYSSSATITWHTSNPADSSVEYDSATVFYGHISRVDAAQVLDHAVTLPSLVTGSTYFYQVQSRDTEGVLTVLGGFSLDPGQTSLFPVILSSSAAYGAVGKAFAFQIGATNNPTGFDASNLPPGLTVDRGTGLISGTPTSAGAWQATVSATNSYGTTAAPVLFGIANGVPVVTPGTINGTVGTRLYYRIQATNYPTAYGLSNCNNYPYNLILNFNTGELTGAPTTAGTYSCTLMASNDSGYGTAGLTVTITGSALPPPTINSPNSATAYVGYPFTYQVTATNDPTRFDASGLPPGLFINWYTGVISGITTSAGNASVTLTATNPWGTSAPFHLTLTSTGQLPPPPLITSPPTASGGVGDAFNYTITASNGPILFYGATNLPPGLSVDTYSGIISGTPTTEGVWNTTVSANNGIDTGTAPLTITITSGFLSLNVPPFVAINGQISASYSGSQPVSYYMWTLTPQSGTGGGGGGGGGGTTNPPSQPNNSPGAPGDGIASFTTRGPIASLASAQLHLGSYVVQVQLFDNNGVAFASAQANTTIVPGDLAGVREYPNPWRSDRGFPQKVTFDNLTVNTTIKIFTVSGHWVKTLPTSSTSVTWDLTNDSGNKVASGIYIYEMKTDSGQKATGKLVIIK